MSLLKLINNYNKFQVVKIVIIKPFNIIIIIIIGLVAGVLYIHVHSGTDLMSSDVDGLSDPYCVILANKTKVLLWFRGTSN